MTSLSKDNRLFYKQLFSYLCIKLDLNDNLSIQEKMLIDHLKSGKSISIHPFFFNVTTLELYLLEKTLLTIGFPNLINERSGDVNWNYLLNTDEDILIIRKYFINLLLKSASISFDFNQLDNEYVDYYHFAKSRKINSIGSDTNGRNTAYKLSSLRTFLDSKLASTINSISDLVDETELDTNYVKRINNKDDGKLNLNNKDDGEKTKCCCGCGEMFMIQSDDYYQHLMNVNNEKILDHTNTKLRCFICHKSSINVDYDKKPPLSTQSHLYRHIKIKHLGYNDDN